MNKWESAGQPYILYVNGFPFFIDYFARSTILYQLSREKNRINHILPITSGPKRVDLVLYRNGNLYSVPLSSRRGNPDLVHAQHISSDIRALTRVRSTLYNKDLILGFDHYFAMIRGDNEAFLGSIYSFASLDRMQKAELPLTVRSGYSLGKKGISILDTDKGLKIWEPQERNNKFMNNFYDIPGTKVKKITAYTAQRLISNYDSELILTDEGLFQLTVRHGKKQPYEHLVGVDPICEGIYNRCNLYPVLLPGGVDPDDVKDMKPLAYSNIFLLTNDGEVYSLGKNTYYQRGTTKKLKPNRWNRIEYPEPIKRIEVLNWARHPGLFALSESGNLYYHGYNEKGFIPGVKKNQLQTPIIIAEGRSDVFAFPEGLLIPDKNGDPDYMELGKYAKGKKDIKVNVRIFRDVSRVLELNLGLLKKVIDANCV